MVKVQPTEETNRFFPGIPPTAVGGSSKFSLPTRTCWYTLGGQADVDLFLESPNGSWGMVKVRPTEETNRFFPGIPPTEVGGSLKFSLPTRSCWYTLEGRADVDLFLESPAGAGEG